MGVGVGVRLERKARLRPGKVRITRSVLVAWEEGGLVLGAQPSVRILFLVAAWQPRD